MKKLNSRMNNSIEYSFKILFKNVESYFLGSIIATIGYYILINILSIFILSTFFFIRSSHMSSILVLIYSRIVFIVLFFLFLLNAKINIKTIIHPTVKYVQQRILNLFKKRHNIINALKQSWAKLIYDSKIYIIWPN